MTEASGRGPGRPTAGRAAVGPTAADGPATGGPTTAGPTAAGGGAADGLPASLAAVWGLRERPGKGPKPGLSLEKIVAAAVHVGATDGLAAVSMGRVAAELGASTMALYRYVGSKSELLNLMVDAAFGPPPPLPESAVGWRAALSHWAWAELATMRASIWAVPMPISGPPATPNQVAWMEQGLRCMRGTGLTEGQKMSVILLLSGYVRSQAMLEAQLSEAIRTAGITDQQMMLDYNRILATVIDPQRFPELTAVVESGVMGKADPPDEEFTFGLQRILDGIGTLVDSLP
jgi:AcrR family transcriptional regulator